MKIKDKQFNKRQQTRLSARKQKQKAVTKLMHSMTPVEWDNYLLTKFGVETNISQPQQDISQQPPQAPQPYNGFHDVTKTEEHVSVSLS